MSLLSDPQVMDKFEERLERERRKLKEKLGLDEDMEESDDCLTDDDEVEIDNEEFFSVEEVRDKKVVKTDGKEQEQYEVKWRGYEETTWEPLESFVTNGSKLAIFQFYERMWKTKFAACSQKEKKKMNAEKLSSPPRLLKETSKKVDVSSTQKFSSSAGDKRRNPTYGEPTVVKQFKSSKPRPTFNESISREKKATEESALKRRNNENQKPQKFKSSAKSYRFSQSAYNHRSGQYQQQQQKKPSETEKEWEKKLKLHQEKQQMEQERIRKEKELAQQCIEDLKYREMLQKFLEDIGDSENDEIYA